MINNWKCASLELSKKLIELGVVLETEKYWVSDCMTIPTFHLLDKSNDGYKYSMESYPAPDVAELIKILPYHTRQKQERSGMFLEIEKLSDKVYRVNYHKPGGDELCVWQGESLANELCSAYIWLIENKHIEVK